MVKDIFDTQRSYFKEGNTRDYASRKRVLTDIKKMVIEEESRILQALKEDLNKSPQEAYTTEILPVMVELDYALKNLRSLMREKRCKGSLFSPMTSYSIKTEPKGQVLIVSPFNYPFQLSLVPIISAIAAGNTVIIKVSELSVSVGKLLVELLNSRFIPSLMYCTDVEPSEFSDLFELDYNHIFFTGSTRVGREIYKLGVKNLASVTLELGGKSPVVVHKSANLKLAAKRIVWGKFLNAGQTCIAPDYLLLDRAIGDEFLGYLVDEIKLQFAEALKDDTYVKIISERHFDRLVSLLEGAEVYYGGGSERLGLKFEPTIVKDVSIDSLLMKEEIFGPILPVMYFDIGTDIFDIVAKNPDPLAFYVFARDRVFEDCMVSLVPSGGCCINDVIIHLLSVDAPFGGRGNSGIGRYHGAYGFKTFSHEKCVCRASGLFDMKLRYVRGNMPKIMSFLKKFKGW